jgi:dTDP-glucose 4,6-dehydratase
MKKILVTGGAGFIGHHVVEHFLKNTDWDISVLDRLNYASSGLDRLREIRAYNDLAYQSRVSVFVADFTNPINEGLAKELGNVDYIAHLGAETHVDRSIEDPGAFERANVLGTLEMLEFARKLPSLKKFIYFSTDEIFGPAPQGVSYREGDRHSPGNPYAASKAAAEDFCVAYANTYGLPIMITNTMNVFGERQHPEKFIPMVIRKVRDGEKVIIHADSTRTKAGSRFYLHARNVANALHFLLENVEEYLSAKVPDQGRFNISGEREVDNFELAEFIASLVGKELQYEQVDFHSSRPGHDLRYALDGSKLKRYGWEVPVHFEDSLRKVVAWTLKNPQWLDTQWGERASGTVQGASPLSFGDRTRGKETSRKAEPEDTSRS